ncbi:MAG TPA: ABC transporter substrate-binding protein [Streptosporangiaceae bacterium]
MACARSGMGRFIRNWTVGTVLLLGLSGLAACSSAAKLPVQRGGGFGALPKAAGSALRGGTVSFGLLPGATPQYIFPITPAAESSSFTINDFQKLMWRPLYWPVTGVEPEINYQLSLASAPEFSNGNTTVTIHLAGNYRWSNGQPVEARDVIFSIDLVKAAVKESAANWGNYTPGFFPDNVAAVTAPNPRTVVMQLTRAYNPEWFLMDELGLIVPLPSAAWARTSAHGPVIDFTSPAEAKQIYDFLNAQSKLVASYAANPLWQTVDGPFRLTAFDAATGANSMVPNPGYTGPYKDHIAHLNQVTFTSNTAEMDALLAHQLTVGTIPGQDIPSIRSLTRAGYDFYGYPGFGWSYMPFNFKNTSGHWNSIIAQLYVRQALAHLIDQNGYINSIYQGAAEPAYGPVPSLPLSQFTPPDAKTDPYPYSIAAAKALLTAHGWHVTSGGTDTCAHPGAGAGRCGAGIPSGTALSFNLIYDSNDSSIQGEDVAFASAAQRAGIKVNLDAKPFNTIITNYNNPSSPAQANAWEMEDFGGFGLLPYPTTNAIFTTTGSFNFGSYSSATADSLIRDSVYSSNRGAVKNEAAFLTRDLPALFLPNTDVVVAWQNKLSGPPSSFAGLTQYAFTPEAWYFTK